MKRKNQDEVISEERVDIAEKVKFWEEQDKINKSLIPRVIKMNEIITKLSETVDSYSNLFSNQEIRIKKRFDEKTKEVKALHNSLEKLSDELKLLSRKNKTSIKKIDEFNSSGIEKLNEAIKLKYYEASDSVAQLKDETNELIESLRRKNNIIISVLIVFIILTLISFFT